MTSVFIVYNDRRKDFSKAEIFGELRDIFSSVGRNYDGKILIEHARSVLGKAEPGDYLLLVGDPALCSICTTVMCEMLEGHCNILRWNRDHMEYTPLQLDFEWSYGN